MIYAPGGTEAKEQLSEYKRQEKFKNREDSNVSQNQDSNQSELNESSYLEESKEDGANVQNLTPAASAYSYFLFRINSADLSVSEKNKINKLRPLLKKPDAKVLIVGYADKTGQFKSNLNLSWLEREDLLPYNDTMELEAMALTRDAAPKRGLPR